MANTLLTIDMISSEALRLAHEKLAFIGTINRQFDDSFGKNGGKIGSTLRIRLPSRYTRTTGSRVMDAQDAEEEKTTLTVATQDHVDMRFNSAELALSLDNFSKIHLEPAMAVLCSGVEGDMLTSVTKDVYNAVGTAGTTMTAAYLGNARAKLNQYLAPKDNNRCIQASSVSMASLVSDTKALFHDSTQLSEAFKEGFIGRMAMGDFYENERVYAHTTGSDHTTMTVNDAAIASGDSTLTLAGATMSVGTVFTIASVLAVHPETKVAYSHLQQFVVTAVSGNDYTFSPTIYSTGAKQNVYALPVTAAVVTAVGSASTTYTQNLMYHKDAFTFVSADLPIMGDAAKCSVKNYDGLGLRVWQASDIRNDELLTRIDILYGYKTIRPEWAVRITD